jgi:penicillin amidase
MPARATRGRSARIHLSFSIGLAFAASLATSAFGATTITAPGLSAPGKITWDALGAPTIQAASDNDAAFLQGYAHAQYRFFEMDLTRRAVSGTLAALVGPSQLANDVQARTLGLRRAAEKTYYALSDDMRGWLAAYSAGVNFWLATNQLPPEYGALDLTHADAWTPVDSIAVGKGLAFQLSFDLDISPTIQLGAYQASGHAAGYDGTALFFGDVRRAAPPDDRVTVPGFQPSASFSTQANLVATAAGGAAADAGVPAIGDVSATTMKLARDYRNAISANPLFQRALQGRDSPIGSNEWVVAGQNTASGKPILSNDPHLSLAYPPVFTEQHIYSTDGHYAQPMDVTGVTVPGAPGVIQGCNQRLCWGTTTNSLDVTDTFQETLKLNSYGLPYAIVHNGVDEPVQLIFQSYFVNQLDGTPDHITRDNSIGYLNGAITVIVPRRNNGPLVVIDSASSTGLSIAYTGWGATFELQSFRQINRAANLDDFRTALSYFDFGSQNFAYADVDGNIAYFVSAEAPVRTDLQAGTVGGGVPPFLIRDGSGAAHHDWLPVQHPQPNQATPYEILPASEMPFVVNPSSGYFANANNDPIGFSLDNNPLNQARPGGGIYYLDRGGADAWREGRIDRVLAGLIAAGHKITPTDMQALQANTQSLDAELLLPYLLTAYDNAGVDGAWSKLAALATDPRVQEAITRLRAWDYSSPTGIQQGYDPGDNPLALPAPSQAEKDASVAASIWALWRSFALRNTIDATLAHVGLQNYPAGASDGLTGFKFLLDSFPVLQGKGASGLQFFNPQYLNAPGAPSAAAARDFVLLFSLKSALDQFTSGAMAPAFHGSLALSGYNWGMLHRITFSHPLGGPFSIPGEDGFTSPYGFTDLSGVLGGIPRGGGWQTVNVGDYNLRGDGANDFTFHSGSARRFVGEMSSVISASEVIPGGNSGVLGSAHYADQLPLWLSNLYHPLPIPVAIAAATAQSEVDFTP